MNYWKFLLYTTIGAGIWHTILAAMGWYLHAIVPEEELDATIERYNHHIVLVIVALVILVLGYVVIKKKTKKQQ